MKYLLPILLLLPSWAFGQNLPVDTVNTTLLALVQTNAAATPIDGVNTNNVLAGSSVTNLYIKIPFTDMFDDMCLGWFFTGTNSDSSKLFIDSSADGNNWLTNTVVLTKAANSGQPVYTNITMNAIPYWRVSYGTNAGAGPWSNNTITVCFKPYKHGVTPIH